MIIFDLLSLVLLLNNNREICARKTCVNDFVFTCTVRAVCLWAWIAELRCVVVVDVFVLLVFETVLSMHFS